MVLWNTQKRISTEPSDPSSGYKHPSPKSRVWERYLYIHVHNGIITIAKTWDQLELPSTEEWINTMCYIHTTGCYSALIRKEILTYVITSITLEENKLSEINQSQKDTV